MTKREDQMRERIHDVEEQLVKAAIMITEARERAEAAERELILTKASAEGAGSLLLDVQQDCIAAVQRAEAAEKERDELKAALERRGEIVFGRDGD